MKKEYDLTKQVRIDRISSFRKALEDMKSAELNLASAGWTVESLEIGMIRRKRQRRLDDYIAEHFPVK